MLNHYFVPVLARNRDYRPTDNRNPRSIAVPATEKAEYDRIYRETLQAGLSAGTVHVYLLNPAGHVVDSMHVAQATDPARLLGMLERTVHRLHTAPGKPLVSVTRHSAPPAHPADALVIHVTARYVECTKTDEVRPEAVLGTRRSGQWAALPSEEWIVLARKEWARLLPGHDVGVRDTWLWDPNASAQILTHFYPPTENTDVSTNHLDAPRVRATVLSIHNGIALARLTGELKLEHPFYHRPTHERASAELIGFIEFEPATVTVRNLGVVTKHGSYGEQGRRGMPFGVAAHLVRQKSDSPPSTQKARREEN